MQKKMLVVLAMLSLLACSNNIVKPPEEVSTDGHRFVEEGRMSNRYRVVWIYCDTYTEDRIYLPSGNGGLFVIEDGCAE